MKIEIDTEAARVIHPDGTAIDLYSTEGFRLLSDLWVKIGWNQKYVYTFSWLGRPIIQLPEDLVRIQEVIHRLEPDLIVETGVAHGGSLVFYASLCKVMGKGRVVGVDVEIRAHNRAAIEAHPLSPLIQLIEGDSVAPATIDAVRAAARGCETVLVLLDSNHSKDHVRRELDAYAEFVTPGSYIVAADGVMRSVADTPRGQPGWSWDNPATAAREFAQARPDFRLAQPRWPFNESALHENVTHWEAGWLQRVAEGDRSTGRSAAAPMAVADTRSP